MGHDYYRSVGYPYVDLTNGGSLAGILEGLGATIALSGPHTRIIPGHGPITERNGLIATRDVLLAVRDRVASLAASGKTVDEVIAARPTAEFDTQVQQARRTSDFVIRWLYTEVTTRHY